MENLNIAVFYFLNQLSGQSIPADSAIIFFANYLAYILIAIFILIVFFAIPKMEKLQIAGSAVLSALIGRGVFVELIRALYHHPRPFVTLPDVRLLLNENSYSFPSGHATFFFALSSVLYCYNKKWGVVFFVLSTLMVVARVVGGVHYPFDIIGGAIIGTLVGFACDKGIRKYFQSKI